MATRVCESWRPGLFLRARPERRGRRSTLEFLGLLALQDPLRLDVAESLRRCRQAGIRVAMLTGDHPRTARAIAEEVGLLGPLGVVIDGGELPDDDAALGELLEDHFAIIVRAVEQGRATFQNVKRFLTYHLTDNVAELAPFALWALTGGSFPLAIGVLQVLALDIGTDMLPTLALGREPPRRGLMEGLRRRVLVDRALLTRSFRVLGATEAVASPAAFSIVLVHGGWRWGATPEPGLLAVASGTAFAAIALGQMANAFACRSTRRPVWRIPMRDNLWILASVAAELVLLLVFLGVPWLAGLLGGAWPSTLGWLAALACPIAVIAADTLTRQRVRFHT